MKRLSLLLGLVILFGSFGLVHAQSPYPIDFEVTVDPTKTFIHPTDLNTYYMGNTNVYLDIKMANNSGQNFTGFLMPFRFYSPTGSNLIWGATESIERMNGWEESGPYWEMTNEISTSSWDGYLPDSMSHTTATMMTGWPDGDPMQTRLRFYFQVPVAGSNLLTDICEICIEEYDPGWVFEPVYSGFNGPYCFQFVGAIWLPPYVEGGPIHLTTGHNIPFDATWSINYYGTGHGDPVTGICTYDENSNPIGTIIYGGGSYFGWTFDPPCEWIDDGLTHTVTFHLEDAVLGYLCPFTPGYTVELTVTEGGAPEILEDYVSDILVRISETEEITIVLDDPGNDDEIWSCAISHNPWGPYSFDDGYLSYTAHENDDGINYTFTVRAADCLDQFDEAEVTFWARSEILCGDPNEDSQINILDIIYIINALYKGTPGPGPLEISDVNNDGAVNILDIIRIINYKYKFGPGLNCPAWE